NPVRIARERAVEFRVAGTEERRAVDVERCAFSIGDRREGDAVADERRVGTIETGHGKWTGPATRRRSTADYITCYHPSIRPAARSSLPLCLPRHRTRSKR